MADGRPEQGLATAAGLALENQPAQPGPEPEQLDLLGLPPINNGKDVVVPRGTRAGIRNRRTAEWQEYLLTKYPSPLEGLLAMGNLPIAELAKSLSCSLRDAAMIVIKCREVTLPYLHPRLSSVEVTRPGEPKS